MEFLEEYQQRKSLVLSAVAKAEALELLGSAEAEAMRERLEASKLVIGVIGQMKCGKSTFLNSFVFGRPVLPTATTPMTAALSVIGHGATEGLTAEFYTRDEWLTLQDRAAQDPAGKSKSEAAAIKAARELMAQAALLGDELQHWLGKNKSDSLDHLPDYVGATGRWVALTKAVRITMPLDYLKGVEIVDTPGLNDPIASREERTRDFLHNADAVVLLLYAGRAFDATDCDILTRQVAQAGVGRVLVGINKYDVAALDPVNPYTVAELVKLVAEQVRKTESETGGEVIGRLLGDTTPIAMSAQMALLGRMSRADIEANEELAFDYQRLCQGFGVASPEQLRTHSRADELSDALLRLIDKEKGELLLRRPLERLRSLCAQRTDEAKQREEMAKGAVSNYSGSDADLETRQKSLERAKRRLGALIECLMEDIQDEAKRITQEGARSLEDTVHRCVESMKGEVHESIGVFKNTENLKSNLEAKFAWMIQRELLHKCQATMRTANTELLRCLDDFVTELPNRIPFDELLPDYDETTFTSTYKSRIRIRLDERQFRWDGSGEAPGLAALGDVNALLRRKGRIPGAETGFWKRIWGDAEGNLTKEINGIANSFRPEEFLGSIQAETDAAEGILRDLFDQELLKPIAAQVADALQNKAERQSKLKAAQAQLQKATEALSDTDRRTRELLAALNQGIGGKE